MGTSTETPAPEVAETDFDVLKRLGQLSKLMAEVGMTPRIMLSIVHDGRVRHRFREGLKQLLDQVLLLSHPTQVIKEDFDPVAAKKMAKTIIDPVYRHSLLSGHSGITREIARYEVLVQVLARLDDDFLRSFAILYYGLSEKTELRPSDVRQILGMNKRDFQKQLDKLNRRLFMELAEYDSAWAGAGHVPIEWLSANATLIECLRDAGITTVDKLLAETEDELKAMVIPDRYFPEIYMRLEWRGLKLKVGK